MTHEEKIQVLEQMASNARFLLRKGQTDDRITMGLTYRAEACAAGAAALRREPQESVVDAAVTAMYRKFKEWSARGFTADDVTWCEVKAEILKVVRFEISREQCKPIEVVASYDPQPTQEP